MFIGLMKGDDTMDYVFWGTVAMKLGMELYKQMSDLLGPTIPTWDELATENADFAVWIEAEKNK